VRSADVVCTARGAKRQCCQLLTPNAVHDCPVFGTFSKKYRKKELKKNTSEQLRLRTAVEFNGERKRVFCPPTFAGLSPAVIWQGGQKFCPPCLNFYIKQMGKEKSLPICFILPLAGFFLSATYAARYQSLKSSPIAKSYFTSTFLPFTM
jgi:hypothetical protein